MERTVFAHVLGCGSLFRNRLFVTASELGGFLAREYFSGTDQIDDDQTDDNGEDGRRQIDAQRLEPHARQMLRIAQIRDSADQGNDYQRNGDQSQQPDKNRSPRLDPFREQMLPPSRYGPEAESGSHEHSDQNRNVKRQFFHNSHSRETARSGNTFRFPSGPVRRSQCKDETKFRIRQYLQEI